MRLQLTRIAAAAAVLLSGAASFPFSAGAAAAAPATEPVQVQVINVDPPVPPPVQKTVPLQFTLLLTNTTGHTLHDVSITAQRPYDWIASQQALDTELSKPTPPSEGNPIQPAQPVQVDLPPGPTTVTFRTTTGEPNDAGLCVCAEHAIYPVWFSAYAANSELLGQGETFVPSFFSKPAPVQVGWVWPLMDRPHRLLSNHAFLDDELADSVRSGRLDRSLQVVETVEQRSPDLPITLLIDPELLDELQVMATTDYQVQSPSGKVAGTGRAAAADWLQRLRAVLDANPDVKVALTPYGDPDIEAVTRAGLPWSSTLPVSMQQHVSAALGVHIPDSEFAWPPSAAMSQRTLSSIARSGVTSVVLSSKAVVPRTDANGLPLSLATLDAGAAGGHSQLTAALVNPEVEHTAAEAMSQSSTGAALPRLLAEIGVQAAQDPQASHAVFISAPRHFNPSPELAVRTILETSSSMFTEPVNVINALTGAPPPGADQADPAGSAVPAVPARLAPADANPPRLDAHILRRVRKVTRTLPSLNAMLRPDHGAPDPRASALLDNLSQAVQLAESSAWLPRSSVGGRGQGAAYAHELVQALRNVLTSVHIVNPKDASYTLASDNSPLPITVENDLPFSVTVRLRIWTVNQVTGFSTPPDLDTVSIDPRSKSTVHVPTRVQRSGRIPIDVQLRTPDKPGRHLGRAVPLYVHSTVLGTIGVIITDVAGGVLVLALLIRFVRRWRQRRRPPAAPDGAWPSGTDPLEPVSPDGVAATPTPAQPVAETVPPSESGQ
ncbi:MAG TPA: DUF6049 family protein [Jatrophihabitans sp.]|nr:DUF6049 family protein [Jatrophihabitans sp.]